MFLVIILCLLGFSDFVSSKNDASLLKNNDHNFGWLLGSWKRSNETEGLQTFELWKKINDDELIAHGYTLKKSDTIWQESIKLTKTGEEWNYIVKLQNAKTPTIFKVTKIEINSFTCENPNNEFPKKIRYAKVQKGMNSVISGDGKVILFQFSRTP